MSNRNRVSVVVLRAFTALSLFISSVILATAHGRKVYGEQLKFSLLPSLQYVMAATVIGAVYSLVQLLISLRSKSTIPPGLVFAMDLVMAFLLLSAGSAGGAVILQIRKDYREQYAGSEDFLGFYKFWRYVSVSLCFEFFGFILVTICSIMFAKRTYGS